MENGVTVSISPIQMLLSLAFQAWIIIFPIIIIKKLNHVIGLFETQDENDGVAS